MDDIVSNKRTTRGIRISVLTGEEAKLDDEFYNSEIWKEELSEDDSYEETEEVAPDEFDSDFNDTEDDDEDDDENSNDEHKKRKVTDKSKYREPVIAKKRSNASFVNKSTADKVSTGNIKTERKLVQNNNETIDLKPREVRESTKNKTRDADTARLQFESSRNRIKYRPPIKHQFEQDDLLREALDTEIESQVWLDRQKLLASDDNTVDKPTKAFQLANNYIRYISRKGSYNTITFPTTESMPIFLREPNHQFYRNNVNIKNMEVDSDLDDDETIAEIDYRQSTTFDGKNAFDQAIYFPITPNFRSFSRIVSPDFSFSWVYCLAVSKSYCPIQIINKNDYELRMRVVGITSGSGKSLKVFDCELGKVLYNLEINSSSYSVVNAISLSQPPKATKLSPLLAAGLHTGQVYIYDIMTGTQIYENVSNYNHGGPISAISIYEGELSVMIVCSKNVIYVWAFERNYRQATIKDHKSDITSISTFASYSTHHITTNVSNIKLLPSLFITSDRLGIVNIYHIVSCRLLYSFLAHIGPIYSTATTLSVDDNETRYFCTAGNDGYIRVWTLNNINSSSMEHSFHIPYDNISGQLVDPKIGEDPVIPLLRTLGDHTGPVHAITICYPIVISGGSDKIIRFWNLNTGELLAKLTNHTGLISSLAITLTPHIILLSGSHDNTTRIWDLELSDREDIKTVCELIINCRRSAITKSNNSKK